MKDLRNFTGGIDFDSDPRNISNEDYISASGFASGVTKKGAIVNMLGNVKINHTLPEGNNTVIGSLRNIKENSIIYWVYNDLGNHSILEYYCLTKVVEPILEPKPSIGFTTEFLGFTLENKIHSSFILDDILGWTDNNVSPRKINKKRAKDFLNQLTPSATNIPYNNLLATGTFEQKIQFIEFIQWKPLEISRIEMAYDSTRNTNYLTEKMVQMKYRYIYDDNEVSRWSDGTTISLPTGQENANGVVTLKTDNNFVRVWINTGHPRVKYIDVAFRFGDRGIWARLDEPIKKYDNNNQRLINDYISYEINFYNDGVLVEVVDELDNADWVPLLCKTLDIVDGNRLVVANNVEGYQNPDIDVTVAPRNNTINLGSGTLYAGDKTPSRTLFTIAPVLSSIFPAPPGFIGPEGGPVQNPNIDADRQVICIPYSPEEIILNSVISFKLILTNFSPTTVKDYFISYTITDRDLVNFPVILSNNLVEVIRNTANPEFIQEYQGTAPTTAGAFTKLRYNGIAMRYITLQDPWDFGNVSQFANIQDFAITTPTQKEVSLKRGAYHPFGIVYRDKQGRDGGVVTNDNMVLYVPYLPETEFRGAPTSNSFRKVRAEFRIRHTPPEWAWTYEIVYAKNNLKKYTQFALKQAVGGILPLQGNSVIALPNGNYTIDCTYIVDYITKDRIQTSVDFQFEPGDRLRFIQNDDNYVSEYIECKVLDFDEATNIMTLTPFDTSLVTNTVSPLTLDGTIAELFAYQPNISNENRPYFSIGNVFPIIDAGTPQRRHDGNVRSQNGPIPTITRLEFGDTYLYKRYFKNNTIAKIIESENYSDFYPSNNIGISSIYAVIPDNKTKRYEQSLRYGGRYFPNTNTNNLCRFNGSDFDVLNTMYGPINKIINIGYTLKCLQTKKNTSIYIDRTMTFNADGEQQIVLTDKVLGAKNPSELDYGCEHPESVVADDRQVYFFDVNTGSVIQDSANGMYAISDYKAKTYWRNISETIKNKPNIFVYGFVDNFNSYVGFTIQDNNSVPIVGSQTLCYHEVENRWKSFQPFIGEYYGSNAMVLVSFKNGELWEHNRLDVARNNFFGVQYNSEIDVVSNIEYPKVKVFNGIAIYSNKYFYSPNIGDVRVQSNETYLQGMVSRLVKSKFRDKEGVLYADYLRDASTPNSGTQQQALLSGRKLRGEVLIQKLVNDDTDEVVLYSVIIHSVGSDLSG